MLDFVIRNRDSGCHQAAAHNGIPQRTVLSHWDYSLLLKKREALIKSIIYIIHKNFSFTSVYLPPHQDVTHKIVDAIGAIAGSSLEQTTWLRRNLEVKPSPKIMVDGNNLESDVEGDF